MSEHIERRTSFSQVSITSSSADGVTHTHVQTSESVDETRVSLTDGGGRRSEATGREDACFDVDTCCDAREKALIESIRAYLRPQRAPESLVRRLHRMIVNEAHTEETRGDE